MLSGCTHSIAALLTPAAREERLKVYKILASPIRHDHLQGILDSAVDLASLYLHPFPGMHKICHLQA